MPDSSASMADLQKRKRDGDDGGTQLRRSWIPQPPPPQSAHDQSIKYLTDASLPRLDLVRGDCPELLDAIRTIEAYESVLARHESLAARLGAQMTSPKLVKALESLFEGTINVLVHGPATARPPPSWMEVVAFAKSNPELFNLTVAPDGRRECRFTLNPFTCTIGENDWRLIISGAVDRFGLVPLHSAPQDEEAELATVEILEERLQSLILNADKVAEKARQLKYRLGGRKAGIKSRQPASQQPEGSQSTPQPRHLGYNLKEDLLNQFVTPARTTVSGSRSPQLSGSRHDDFPQTVRTNDYLMSSHVESVPKGGLMIPCCDLCRRGSRDCVKYATACEACTKKHRRCTWNDITALEAWDMMLGIGGRDKAVATSVAGQQGAGAMPDHGTPLVDTRQHTRSPFDANSSSVRRSVEGGGAALLNRRPLPETNPGQSAGSPG